MAATDKSGIRLTSDYLAEHATARPNEIALVDEGQEITFGRFYDDLRRTVRALSTLKLPQDAIVSVEFLGLYRPWLLQLGFECLGIANASYADAHDQGTLKLLLDRSDLVIHLGDAPATEAPCLHADTKWWRNLFRRKPGELPFPPDPHTPARVVCSSGTTGEIKVIPQTLAQLDFRGRTYGDLLGFDSETRFMVGMGFAVQLDQLLAATCLRRGGRCHYAGILAAPDAINFCSPTHALLLPMHLPTLLGEGAPANPDGFLTLAITGGHVADAVRARLLPEYPHRLVEAYATNETSIIADMDADSVGTILPGVTVEIVDDEERPLPQGAPGRVRVKSPGNTEGYLFETETEMFKDEWFYPGDIGQIDTAGRLHLLGRGDDIINLRGLKVNATNYEQGLVSLPGIVDAGILSARDGVA
ncbi:MAG TPA: hypothetical protein DCE33_14520 [Rhodospirillaceae bacterium]|nr:hypothetical protein [Rhodospirillaceae bacterium]